MEKVMRKIYFNGLLGIFISSLLLSTAAQAVDADCANKSGDVAIKACTDIVESGNYNGKPLSKKYISPPCTSIAEFPTQNRVRLIKP